MAYKKVCYFFLISGHDIGDYKIVILLALFTQECLLNFFIRQVKGHQSQTTVKMCQNEKKFGYS